MIEDEWRTYAPMNKASISSTDGLPVHLSEPTVFYCQIDLKKSQ